MTMQKFEIVDMKREWIDSALGIYQWYVKNSTVTFQIREADAAQMEGILFLDSPKYRSFAALEDGAFAGYGIVTRFKPREAFDRTAEVTIYLARGATGKGYGKKMLAHLESFAREQNMHLLVALISGENDASCALFSRAGYSPCARYHDAGNKFGRWIDLVCYEKIL
jgi:phosphinothricin acetyltransferase